MATVVRSGHVLRVSASSVACFALAIGVGCGKSESSNRSDGSGATTAVGGSHATGGEGASAALAGSSPQPMGGSGGTLASGGSESGRAGASANSGAGTGGVAAGPSGGRPGSGGGVGGNGGSSGESGPDSAGMSGDLCPFLPSKGEDVAGRLTALGSTPVLRSPTILSRAVLDGTLVVGGVLTSTSEVMATPLGDDDSCTESSEQPTNVHALELVGPGPHQLIIDGCVGETPTIQVFQSLEGSESALDMDAPCRHWIASTDLPCGTGRRLVASGFAEGTVLLAASSLLSSEMGRYQVRVSSSTSCSGGASTIEPGSDPASTPFLDPNPMPCTSADTARCEGGVDGPSSGTWEPCCLTEFLQNQEGKCGLSGNGSACVERQQPGNLDAACPDGTLQYSFPPNTLAGDGTGCCSWRTGLCGLMSPFDALNLGCSPLAPDGGPAELPCTPDYSAGILF